MKHETRVFRYEINRGARAFLALGSIIALVFVASACKNYQLDDAAAARAGTGSVTVRLSDGTGARLVVPNVPLAAPIARYDISCSRAGYESKTATGLTDASALTVNSLAEGDWTLTVDACDATGKKVATGVTIVTIVAGKTATAAVVLSPIYPRTTGGQGTVSLVFKCTGFQAQSNKWHIEFTPAAGGTTVPYTYESNPAVTIDTGANTITVNATLDSGDWDMVFYLALDSGDTFASVADVVKVYDGLTSGTATGAPIQISAADFFKTDRVRYVSNTAVTGRMGKTPAQACTLAEAIQHFNGCYDLTEADPGVIILTENVVHSPQSGSDILYIQKPMKIMSHASAATPYSISADKPMNTLFCVDATSSYDAVSLALERVTVQPGGAGGAEFGLVQVKSGLYVAKLTLNAGATIKGNASGVDAGGVYIMSGTLVMNAGSEISGNTAEYGAGVRSMGASDEIIMNGGTISGNTAKYFGGGIYTGTVSAIVTLAGGTITNNTASDGTYAGLGAGVFLTRSVGGGFYATAPGGWKAIVYGNHGIGPDLVRQAFVNDLTSFQSIFTAPYDLPTWVDSESPLTIDFSQLTGLSLSTDSDIVLYGPRVTYTAINGTNNFKVSNGTLWVCAPVTGNTSSTQSIVSVTGGKLVLEQGGSLMSNGLLLSLMNGGAVSVSAGSFEMRGGKISACNAQSGGAVSISGSAQFILSGGEISGNRSRYGGGVYLQDSAIMTMKGGLLTSNTADMNGAGVYIGMGGTLNLSDGDIQSNSATKYGGAIYTAGTLHMTNIGSSLNASIQSNTATQGGAGLYAATDSIVAIWDPTLHGSGDWASLNTTTASSYPYFINIFQGNTYQFMY